MQLFFLLVLALSFLFSSCAPATELPESTSTPPETPTATSSPPTETPTPQVSQATIPEPVYDRTDFFTPPQDILDPELGEVFQQLIKDFPLGTVYMSQDGVIVVTKPETYPNFPNKQLVSPEITAAGRTDKTKHGRITTLYTKDFFDAFMRDYLLEDYIETKLSTQNDPQTKMRLNYLLSLRGYLAEENQVMGFPVLENDEDLTEVVRILGTLADLRDQVIQPGKVDITSYDSNRDFIVVIGLPSERFPVAEALGRDPGKIKNSFIWQPSNVGSLYTSFGPDFKDANGDTPIIIGSNRFIGSESAAGDYYLPEIEFFRQFIGANRYFMIEALMKYALDTTQNPAFSSENPNRLPSGFVGIMDQYNSLDEYFSLIKSKG